MSRGPLHHTPDNDAVFDVENIASATECTGLVPFMPMTDAESDALAALGSVRPVQHAPDSIMHPAPSHDGIWDNGHKDTTNKH